MRVGQLVRISVEGDTNIYTGTLARVAPALRESSRMLLVEADVRAQGSLRPGLFARAQIVISASEPALSVPANSLITFAGLEKVVVVVEGKAVGENRGDRAAWRGLGGNRFRARSRPVRRARSGRHAHGTDR